MTAEKNKRKKKKISDLQPHRTHMPIQDALERTHNFDEVTHGYREEDALLEAERCLICPRAKCVDACPVSIDIPTFFKQVIDGDLRLMVLGDDEIGLAFGNPLGVPDRCAVDTSGPKV